MLKRDLLFEIGVEELPADACVAALEYLANRTVVFLDEARLLYAAKPLVAMATPRRLVLKVEHVSERQKETEELVKGPSKSVAYDPNGKPTQAAIGFARSQGVSVEKLTSGCDGKGEYVFAVRKESALAAEDILPGILKKLVLDMQFDKSMRWAGYDTRFSRPVRWLLAYLGNKKLDVRLEMLESGVVTYGPRLSGSPEIKINGAADYFTKIVKAGIVVDHRKRIKLINEEISAAAMTVKGRAAINPKVLDEVVFLVEAPNAVIGTFDKTFLKLPRSVIVTAMESHQRYFPVEAENGKLLPNFIVIHNGPPASADLIRKGHERVLRARLADALFFFEDDSLKPLENRIEALEGIVFQEKLGTVYAKAERVKLLTAEIAGQLEYADDETAEAAKAAMLAKADLTTSMVREFPDLQGIIGAEYARGDGHPELVARAISEHYLPKFFGDKLPETKTGVAVSLADKLDTIAGCFGIGLIPTGSEDPYALRRQGQGIVSIILDEKLGIELEPLVAKAVFNYEKQGVKLRKTGEILADIESFLVQRLKFHFTTEGFRYDVADAVLDSELNDLVALESTARVVDELIGSKVMDDILTGFERCYNLSKNAKDGHVDVTLFAHASEGKLLEAAETGDAAFEKYEADGNVQAYLKALARMRPAIDTYFDDVLVMDKQDKIRHNRLALLRKVARLYKVVADFSKIVREGD